MDRAGEERGLLLVQWAAVPGKMQLARQALAARGCFDLEVEARSALSQRRQAGHYADNFEVAALQCRGEPIAHAQLCAGRGPEKARPERDADEANPPSRNEQER